MGSDGTSMKQVIALYRSPAYSPSQHLQNDRAIMDAVVAELDAIGWEVVRLTEKNVADEQVPIGDLYLNMCQGPAASEQLRVLLPSDTPCINTPQAVLACHRHRLVPLLRDSGVPFPSTILLSTRRPDTAAAHLVTDNGHPIWVKRGDVHAQSADDVVATPWAELRTVISHFAQRGIERVALQAHVPGPVIKFYGVIGREFFHCAFAEPANSANVQIPTERLQDIAECAARALGLTVYGGDAVLATPDTPVLIDLNDWPSFAPVRSAAAIAIARYANQRAHKDRYSCSTL